MGKLKEMYREIWEERKKVDREGGEYVECVDCGKRIYECNLKVHHFSHDKSKGSRPDLKFDKSNLSIRCYKCHSWLDNKQKVSFNIID